MRIIYLSLLLCLFVVIGFACGGPGSGSNNSSNGGPGTGGPGGSSPTEAYKMLYAAVKSKNTEAIKQMVTAQTQQFAVALSQQQSTPIEKVYENGFTATTFAEALPEIRDERIDGNMGALEVRNNKEGKWEDLPFVKEENGWKLAVGDIFKGTYKSPGKGRALKEQEAANAAGKGIQEVNPFANANSSTNTNVPVPGRIGPAR